MDIEYISNLSHQHVLPVARGLIALILYNSANVDMFLLACKVSKFDLRLLYVFIDFYFISFLYFSLFFFIFEQNIKFKISIYFICIKYYNLRFIYAYY